ncbi:MAG: CoA transferase, partial [Rhodoferax sp.]
SRWRQVDTPVGEIPALLPPGRINSFEYRMDAVPAVGEHTDAILRELGQSDAGIAAMRSAHAI